MATTKELAEQYAKRILNSSNKKEETQKVLNEINNLKYSGTNNIISNEDKLDILKEMQNKLNPRTGQTVLLEHAENKSYLQLVAHMISLLEND